MYYVDPSEEYKRIENGRSHRPRFDWKDREDWKDRDILRILRENLSHCYSM